jgi:hypothetical protein
MSDGREDTVVNLTLFTSVSITIPAMSVSPFLLWLIILID